MKFHHVGYAVKSISEYLEEFLYPLFAPEHVSDVVVDPIQQVKVCFAQMQGGTTIELVEPYGENKGLSTIVGSQRGGLYHLCYEVEDLEEAMHQLREKKYLPLGKPVPAVAFDGRRIVFLLTPQRDLIELLESKPHI